METERREHSGRAGGCGTAGAGTATTGKGFDSRSLSGIPLVEPNTLGIETIPILVYSILYLCIYILL